MPTQTAVAPQPEEVRVQIPGFQRGQSQARRFRLIENRFDQFAQMPAPLLPPRAEVDACQHDLLRPARQRKLNIADHLLQRTRPPLPARHGGDAERAGVVAPVLHFNESARAAVKTGERLAGEGLEVEF